MSESLSNASNPGWFALSDEKLKQLHPELYPGGGVWYWMERHYGTPERIRSEIAWCLQQGDCRAAVVVSLEPLLVAAYSDEFDAVVVLRFPSRLAACHDLSHGTRLITVSNYERSISRQTDFRLGPQATKSWTGFYPLIAEFLTDDREAIARVRGQIHEDEWTRTEKLGNEARQRTWPSTRDGRPRYARNGGGWLPIVVGLLCGLLIGVLSAVKLLWR
jgi:hypothetical protein